MRSSASISISSGDSKAIRRDVVAAVLAVVETESGDVPWSNIDGIRRPNVLGVCVLLVNAEPTVNDARRMLVDKTLMMDNN